MKYKVKLTMVPIYYDVEANDKGEAGSIALDMAYEEAMYDLLKWVEIEAEEVNE